VFKVFAAVLLVGGVLAAVVSLSRMHGENISSSQQLIVFFSIVGGAIFAASAMAFFGYMLQLLVAIHFDIRFVDSQEAAIVMERAARHSTP
jgi:hypothetical protein